MYRLLIVDNEYIERAALKSILSKNFSDLYEIYEAENGLKAIEMAKTHSPHLIFMDIKMPGCSGIEAAKQIQEFLPEVNLVFITAYDYFDYAKEAISLRANELLLKPVEVHTVLDVTRKITEKIIQIEENRSYSKEIESKFEQITKRFQHEFIETIHNYNASFESIEHYLNILDIDFQFAALAIFDFQKIQFDKTIGGMQKEFIITRFINKVKEYVEKLGILSIAGIPKEDVEIIFIASKNYVTKYSDASDTFLLELTHAIEEIDRKMNLHINYVLSEQMNRLIELPFSLYRLRQSLSQANTLQSSDYPYALEEELLHHLEKQNFEESRTFIAKIAKIISKNNSPHSFHKEAMELFAIVKRSIKKMGTDSLMPHADELAEKVYSDSEMISFFDQLFRFAEASFENKLNKNGLLIQKLCDYLEEHYNEDISLDQAADLIGFSSFYFTKLIKEHLNMSYVDYLTSIRIRKAKQLLDETNQSVSDIALQVGYSDANYFTRVFKRTEGITPSNYKARNYGDSY